VAHDTPPRPQADPAYGTDICGSVCREPVVVHRRINGMTHDDMDSPDPPSAKAITALLPPDPAYGQGER
jgi:hypothetical protein